MVRHEEPSAVTSDLAILDWGIGGMGFYRLFKTYYPDVSVCYFSDAGAVPYGKQQKTQLIKRLNSIVTLMLDRQINYLVIACNAMSTVLPFWTPPDGFYTTGVIQPAIAAIIADQGQNVGVVGGRRTILSRAYASPLKKAGKTVIQRVAQPLSALIEQGKRDTPEFQMTLAGIMHPLKQCNTLVLACTHYPAAAESFQKLCPKAHIIDPAWETLQWVKQHWRYEGKGGADVFLTTGNSDEMRHGSQIAFGVNIGEIIQLQPGFIDLTDYRI